MSPTSLRRSLTKITWGVVSFRLCYDRLGVCIVRRRSRSVDINILELKGVERFIAVQCLKYIWASGCCV